ncbi:PD-(D/E)XK nuclease superfamily protein [Vibrio phage 1.244.A._10N.261.54.C3]|nr:PD-(D/E)XK nuclease superfamily protein [Vibrio phage 1.244.A._10N.261.54.C3]AUR98645.1 PD-(D/E)XK nuclease superfamily protein [Vibrio phage 1.255.O._10N.286.45.F1]
MSNLAALKRADWRKRGKVFEHRDPPLVFDELECDDSGEYRQYTLPDGTRFYSMTSMLGMTSDHKWLDEWRERIGEEAADAETKRCADRGEGVHFSCEHYLNNEPMERVLEASGDYQWLFKQLKGVLDKRVGCVWVQEIPLFSRSMKVAGRVDLIAMWLNEHGEWELSVIDFKTSNWVKTKDGIQDYQAQLCGYAKCFYDMFGIKINRLVNIIATEARMEPNIIEFTTQESVPVLVERVKAFHNILNEGA